MGGLATTPQQNNGMQINGMIGPDGIQQDMNLVSTIPKMQDTVGGPLPYAEQESLVSPIPKMQDTVGGPLPYAKLESRDPRITAQQQSYQKAWKQSDAASPEYQAAVKRHQESMKANTAQDFQNAWSQPNQPTFNDQSVGTNNYGREFSKPATQEDVIEMEIRKAEQQYK